MAEGGGLGDTQPTVEPRNSDGKIRGVIVIKTIKKKKVSGVGK